MLKLKFLKPVFIVLALALCWVGASMAGIQPADHHGTGAMLAAAAFGITTPFDTQTRLTQIAMAVRPQNMIADLVCPRVPVDAEKFTYTKLDSNDFFQIPDTQIGRSSEANQVEFGASDVTDKVVDYGLDDFVPKRDENVADAQKTAIDPFATATEGTALLVQLAREKRVADLYFNLNTYNANYRSTLSGTSQWSDYTNSDPYTVIMDALDSMLVRPNVAVLGRKSWTRLRSHPKVVAAILNNGGQIAGGSAAVGSATRRALADLLELDDILVGETFYNSNKKGQTATPSRLWGNHAAFLRIDKNVRSTQGYVMPTFAMTAEWTKPSVRLIDEPKRGAQGGTTVRVYEQIKEIVTYQDAGYFFQNVTN